MRHLADFYKTDIYKQVIGHYDRVIEDMDKESQLDWWSQTRVWDSYKITSLEPFYYIWQVQQTAQDRTVLDYGCGPNEFKKFWPNMYGVDRLSFSNGSFFGLPDKVSNNFIHDNRQTFFGIVAICSLHFVEKNAIIKDMNKLLERLSSGCRAYMTFNTERISEASKDAFSYRDCEKMISTNYSQTEYRILELTASEPMGYLGKEGNVKVLLEKV